MFVDNMSVDFESSEQNHELQRLWSRRPTLSALLEEQDLFPAGAQDEEERSEKSCGHKNQHFEAEFEEKEFVAYDKDEKKSSVPIQDKFDESHEYRVSGFYVDPRIVTGYRYKVRLLHEQDDGLQLFNGKALLLESIGRGYSRRLTFQANPNSLNHNDNYFWSDSRPEGYAFEIEVVSVGDKFTLQDANHEVVGSLEVLRIPCAQREIGHECLTDRTIEKRVKVEMLAKVEWFDALATVVVMVSGVAVTECDLDRKAVKVQRVVNASIGCHQRRGYTLTPGIDDKSRRILVNGKAIGDIPTSYAVVGLESYEMPVIGTYVDPRILPGFEYRVRPAASDQRRHLFDGRILRLLSVGRGYGKRITFAEPDAYMWSDSHAEGVGFEPRAVHMGMRFTITSSEAGQTLGVASVMRADNGQAEIDQELVREPTGLTIVKRIHVDVTCHVTLTSTNQREAGEHVMRISGEALVRKEAGTAAARLVRIENIGLDSQLNLLFARQRAELVFHPLVGA